MFNKHNKNNKQTMLNSTPMLELSTTNLMPNLQSMSCEPPPLRRHKRSTKRGTNTFLNPINLTPANAYVTIYSYFMSRHLDKNYHEFSKWDYSALLLEMMTKMYSFDLIKSEHLAVIYLQLTKSLQTVHSSNQEEIQLLYTIIFNK